MEVDYYEELVHYIEDLYEGLHIFSSSSLKVARSREYFNFLDHEGNSIETSNPKEENAREVLVGSDFNRKGLSEILTQSMRGRVLENGLMTRSKGKTSKERYNEVGFNVVRFLDQIVRDKRNNLEKVEHKDIYVNCEKQGLGGHVGLKHAR
jgi:site-specific recombinase XerD